MPRRHITQREAHAAIKRVQQLERQLVALRFPSPYEPGHLAAMAILAVNDRYRGYIEGASQGRRVWLSARLVPEGLRVYIMGEDDDANS